MRYFAAIAVVLLLSLSAGCGDSEQSSSTEAKDTAATQASPPVDAHPGGWPGLKRVAGPWSNRLLIPRGPSPEEVVIRDLKEGVGPAIRPGDIFEAHYVSFDYESGVLVEPFWNTPAGRLAWGTNGLVDGWEPGLKGMRKGGIRELIVPSSMAYGNGARIYVVKMVGIDPKNPAPEPTATQPERSDSASNSAGDPWAQLKKMAGGEAGELILPQGPPPKKLVVKDLRRGEGAKIEPEDGFTLSYIQFDYKTGATGERQWGSTPFTETFGTDSLVKAMEEGLQGMRVGGVRELIAPSPWVYGNPPRVYLLKLLKLDKG